MIRFCLSGTLRLFFCDCPPGVRMKPHRIGKKHRKTLVKTCKKLGENHQMAPVTAEESSSKLNCRHLLDRDAHTIHVKSTEFPYLNITDIGMQDAMATLLPFKSVQTEKIFIIEDLRDKVAELATQKTAIGANVHNCGVLRELQQT